MKKLTIEQKAKAYDEAIEKARRLCAYSTTKPFISDLQDIFPELKESDDERIRKNIIATIHLYYGEPLDDEAKEMIAWLEKQAQKPADKVEHKFNVGDEIKTANEEPLTITKIDEKGYWSEDLFICGFDEECCWDLVEQKPAEWSEEDERHLNNIIKDFETIAKGDLAKDCPQRTKNYIPWLKSLRPQNWTKEDKERYLSCLQKLSTGNPEQPETINSKWFKEHVYPQSQWKPSDEQMKALKEACDEHFDIDGGALWHLYQELKNLKE